ncbi:site-specific integrase [Fischerella sp. PCC 9605]|uniref:site-specific integrase n=1 Tax=Fischerella sp. PCC 9605 TaxID=1173024 RepID=UPI00047874CC|nr:site-specific integrase [Fischerella sp. PCC 9605]
MVRKPKKNKKGSVVIASRSGRLRLRFRVNGKQYDIALGLADTTAGRKLAQTRATQIKADITNHRCTGYIHSFDLTLEKYRKQWREEAAALPLIVTVVDVFRAFIDWKEKEVYTRTLEKYQITLSCLQQHYIGNKPAFALTEDDAQDFCDRLKQKLSPLTLKQRIALLVSCWEWAREYGDESIDLPSRNPWKVVLRRVKVPPKQPPLPFSKEEITAILDVFHRDYPHYYPYVVFLFSSGVRTGEAIALKWKHVNPNFTTIWVGESLSKGVRKSTKTNTARTIPTTERVRELLKSIKPENANPDSLVFTAIGGRAIDVDNFTKRYWKTALDKAGVLYRQPYNCRHSFVTNHLLLGTEPIKIAKITGHKIETLYEYYAGLVTPPNIPDFLQ